MNEVPNRRARGGSGHQSGDKMRRRNVTGDGDDMKYRNPKEIQVRVIHQEGVLENKKTKETS